MPRAKGLALAMGVYATRAASKPHDPPAVTPPPDCPLTVNGAPCAYWIGHPGRCKPRALEG